MNRLTLNGNDHIEYAGRGRNKAQPVRRSGGLHYDCGIGFIAASTITIKYDTAEVATATADTNGAFSINFPVPKSQYGEHTITTTDGTTAEQFTFTMESTPPAIPAPILPEKDIKIDAETYFVKVFPAINNVETDLIIPVFDVLRAPVV